MKEQTPLAAYVLSKVPIWGDIMLAVLEHTANEKNVVPDPKVADKEVPTCAND